MADRIATILAFLFTEDKKEHPMPQKAADSLLQKIKDFIYRKEDHTHGKN